MAKYIIDIPDDGKCQYRYNEDTKELKFQGPRLDPNSFMGLDITISISGVTTYTEPDRKAIENEVWELAQKVDAMDNYSSGRCFGGDFFPIRENGYWEAKAKFEKWCKRTDDIRVGDEVRCMERVGIVVRIDSMDSGSNVVWEDGATAYIGVKDLIKTGRHFDEVENLLERIREE